MATTVIGLKSCDTCRKALKELANAGIDAELRDLRAIPLTVEERSKLLDRFGEALVNRRSTTWRELSEAEREIDHAALLDAHPALMKRPVVEGPGGLTLGWDASARAAHLAGGAGAA